MSELTKKKRILIPVVIGIALIILGAVVSGLIYYKTVTKPKKERDYQLELGEKYLSELDYDNAILAYENAIQIDPKNEKAYLALADIYEDLADKSVTEEDFDQALDYMDKAIQVLELGVQNTASADISARLVSINDKKDDIRIKKEEAEAQPETVYEKIAKTLSEDDYMTLIDICNTDEYLLETDRMKQSDIDLQIEETSWGTVGLYHITEGDYVNTFYVYYGEYDNGNRTGTATWISLHPNGKLISVEKGTFVDDKPNGLFEIWQPNLNADLEFTEYYLATKVNVINGYYDGRALEIDRNGNQEEGYMYQMGKMVNIEIREIDCYDEYGNWVRKDTALVDKDTGYGSNITWDEDAIYRILNGIEIWRIYPWGQE